MSAPTYHRLYLTDVLPLVAVDCFGCGGAYAPLYFVSYKILVSLVMLSLIVPVVIDYYHLSADTEKSTVSRETLEGFEAVRCPCFPTYPGGAAKRFSKRC